MQGEGAALRDPELERLLAPPAEKRYMRMYADDEEAEVKAKRWVG